VLALILFCHSLYSQYPAKRVFRGDSVVIMRVSQADTINMLYNSYINKIDSLKDSVTIKNKTNETLNKTIFSKNDTIFYWKGKYEASRELYKAPRYRDINYEREEAFHLLQKIILVGVIILQLSQLK
jgi:hypothetical protein